MRFPATVLFLTLASCQSMAALGRVIESTAYPAGGAVAGAALGGPPGAAAGAAGGHLIGQAVTHEAAPQAAYGGVREVFLQPTFEMILWYPLMGIPFWAWCILVGYILHRAPWLPGWIFDKLQSRGSDGKEGREEGSLAR